MKKPAITVRAVTLPASERCTICGRHGSLGASAGAMPKADRRGAARIDCWLCPTDVHFSYLRLDRVGARYRCYVCGPCRAAIREAR